MTRGDLIRSLDNNTLAEFLDQKPFCHPNSDCGETYDECAACIKDYLSKDVSAEELLELLERQV